MNAHEPFRREVNGFASEPVIELRLADLKAFLCEAKRSTYAADAQRELPLRPPHSKNYAFERYPFHYEDQYFGEYVDVGEEIVWYRGLPVWGMGYRGGVYQDCLALREKAFDFLRDAIGRPDGDCPTRGPRLYRRGPFTYTNRVTGDVTDFFGEEFVEFEGQRVCFRRYIGGLVRGKVNRHVEVLP